MHVAVEALQLRHDHRGVGRYVRRLLTALPQHAPAIRYSLGVPAAADVAPVRALLAELPGVDARAHVAPIAEWRTLHCDVAWYPWNYVRALPASGAVVPTLHDLAPIHQFDGRWWKVLKRATARRAYAHALAQSHHVITGAEAAATELVQELGAHRTDISVVPHAADDFLAAATGSLMERPASDASMTRPPDAARALLERLQVNGAFLLAVGSQEARKNLRVLFHAMEQLAAEGQTIPLVMCGPRASGVAGYRHRTPSWLRWAGFVSDAELAALYRHATALVFPSRYEGFGLPILEAMAAGGVVICSNASTLPEVGGDAALYFAPDDAAMLARSVSRLLADPSLTSTCRERGLAQAARFSWSESARGTLVAFQRGIAAYASDRR